MLNVKIEFCPLDWYSSSLKAIALHKRMYIFKNVSKQSPKAKKNAICMK